MAEELVYEIKPESMATGLEPQPKESRTLGAYTGQRIPASDYASTDALKRFVPRGKCQRTLPGCSSWTNGKCVQAKYAYMTGGKYPELSYAAMHQEITGGKMNRGSRPVDGIELIAKRGCPLATPNLPEWFASPRNFPADAVNDRMAYRADEWEECMSVEDVLSAILNMDPVNLGFWWYDSDANPGPTGHLPVRGSGGRGGHSLIGCGIVMGYAKSQSGVGVLFNNHHGDKLSSSTVDERGRTLRYPVWGDDGFGVVPVERLVEGIEDFGCYALRTVTIRNEDINVPVPKFA